MKTLLLAAVLGCVVAGTACGSGDGPPTAPSPSDLFRRPSDGPALVRFDGVLYAPHQIIELRPGARTELQVVALCEAGGYVELALLGGDCGAYVMIGTQHN